MLLTTPQLATLKAAILASPAMSSQPQTSDGAQAIADLLNATASPAFTVWKTSESISNVGNNIVGSELATRSTADNTRLQTVVMLSPGGLNPSLVDRRAFFDDIFSGAGGAATRAKLLILWKRLATALEKIFATGTGSDAVPATLVVEGSINYQEVQTARES